MKKFKEHKKKPPVPIDAYPCHGQHSQPKTPPEKDLKEQKYDSISGWEAEHQNNHLGNNSTEVHKKLDIHPDKFSSQAGNAQLYSYTVNSGQVNKNLIDIHHGREPTWHEQEWENESPEETHHRIEDAKREHHEMVNGIDTGIDKHPALTHDLHVYHGASFNPGKLAGSHPDRKIQMPAYLSTSIDKRRANSFARPLNSKLHTHILHVHLKPGDKGVYLGSNSSYDEENEFLMPRNTVLKVHPKPDIVRNKYGSHTFVWHAHVTKP